MGPALGGKMGSNEVGKYGEVVGLATREVEAGVPQYI